jgi:thiol:disulfide interchange protein DsbD
MGRGLQKVMDMNPIRQTGRFRPAWLVGCAGVLWLLGSVALAGEAPSTTDPFAPENKGRLKPPRTAERIDFKVSVSPQEARPGETVKLTITGIPKPGYHTYPVTQRAGPATRRGDEKGQPEAQLTRILFEKSPNFQPLWPITESQPEWSVLKKVGVFLEYDKEFTWSQDVLVQPKASPGQHFLYFRIKLQVCDRTCVDGEHWLEVPITVSTAPEVPLSPALEQRREEKPPLIKVVEVPPELAAQVQPDARETDAVGTSLPDDPEDYELDMYEVQRQLQGRAEPSAGVSSWAGFFGFILQGVFWGGVSLFTPCVFPMIPITVSFFLKQGEKKHHRPLLLASVYSLTIVVVLTIAAIALLSFFRWLSVHPLMNLALGALFIYFALSLFGMYDIQLPSFLARWTAAGEARGGLVGTMFMALTFTIISFACVAPYLGGFGGTTAGANVSLLARMLGGLAFAATFAAPFFLLALFPGLLKKLPQSGGWLNTVKVVMGFLELAAALKFLRAGELLTLPQPTFFTYDLVLGMWVALALLCGLYLLNVFRLPHDSPQASIGVPRLLLGFLFLSLSFYLAPALLKFNREGENQRPNGSVYAWIDSFLLPEPMHGSGGLAWSGNLKAAIDEARRQKKLIFVDFTGEICTNCSLNEHNVFSKPEIRSLFQPYLLVQLYTDKVPDQFYSTAARRTFRGSVTRQSNDAKMVNLPFQRANFGSEQLPLYVILQPLPDNTIRVVGRYDEGKINNEAAFAEFLKEPLSSAGDRVALGSE